MIPAAVLADGLTYACALSLLACGITLLFICTRTFNFAHACMATWGLYVTYTGVKLYGGSPYHYFPLAFLFGAMLGLICYFCINGPLLRRAASIVTLMMSTLGYDLILLSTIQIYCDYLTKVLKLYPRMVSMSAYDFYIFGIRAATIISLILMVGLLSTLHLFLTKAKFGIAIRATIENPMLASLSGIASERVYAASWIIGGGLATMGGAVLAMVMTGTPVMGWLVIVAMFASAILGGLYSIYGAALGGLVVGMTEYVGIYSLARVFGPWILPYKPVIPLVIMAIALSFFPRGLAGIPWSSLFIRVKGIFHLGGEKR